ncbi:MAG: hypothetical protein U0835_02260 [Isosphaeraceae bacterium]
MRRTPRLALSALGLALGMSLAAGEARAQWGYGYYPGGYGGYGQYGWGGWGGGTVQGSIARGLGYYAVGAGQYNLDTAAARSINANTGLRLERVLVRGPAQRQPRRARTPGPPPGARQRRQRRGREAAARHPHERGH